MSAIASFRTVAVIGAGTMGAGIAQIAGQAGHRVQLFDAREGAAEAALDKLKTTLDGLVAKGRLDAATAASTLARIEPAQALSELAGAGLVIEAIVENLAIKQGLLRDLEAIVSSDAVLASNTSSLSITALGRDLKHPGRLVGMHFFNPVPLMKLVEVVSGLRTDRSVAEAIGGLAREWGKTPVLARSTPGFIVNRIARPYYAEALALLQESALTPAQLDAALRGAGFRMGPCELMDLIGHDVNLAVTQSVFDANHGDARYRPSLVQRELVDGGLLGRKSGQGFFRYPAATSDAAGTPVLPRPAGRAVVHGQGALADRLLGALRAAGADVAHEAVNAWTGLSVGEAQLRLTDGRPAEQLAAALGISDVAVFDWPLADTPDAPLAYAVAESATATWAEQAAAWLQGAGFQPLRAGDTPGLAVARTVSMLVNEAADAVQQGVCTPEAADTAMKLGVNYPAGPFEWLQRVGVQSVAQVVDALHAVYRSERYRLSPWLLQRCWREAHRPAGH
jgi:3-hydroxybutyryl-CoA dehydrogenase